MEIIQNINIGTKDLETIKALLRQYLPGTLAWAYGSRVNQAGHNFSDLDIVVFSKPEQQDNIFDLKGAFENAFLPFRIDLHCWDDLPESFRKNIKKIMLYCRMWLIEISLSVIKNLQPIIAEPPFSQKILPLAKK